MAYDEGLAGRVRSALASKKDVAEKRIIGGGLGFFLDGHMVVGVMKDELLVRIGRERLRDVVDEPSVRPLSFKGKQTASFVLVASEALRRAPALQKWIALAATSEVPAKRAPVKKAPAKKAPAKKAPSKKVAATRSAEKPSSDPRVRKLLDGLRTDAKLAPVVDAYEVGQQSGGGGRKFGANALRAKGKLFALFTQDTLVVKLPKERVASLVAKGDGRPFDPGHGRLMKEWLAVVNPKCSWLSLAKEAHAFVARSKS